MLCCITLGLPISCLSLLFSPKPWYFRASFKLLFSIVVPLNWDVDKCLWISENKFKSLVLNLGFYRAIIIFFFRHYRHFLIFFIYICLENLKFPFSLSILGKLASPKKSLESPHGDAAPRLKTSALEPY